MEVNRAESVTVAAVGGVTADVLDPAGRLVVTPNALTLDGQHNVPADLQPGESLASFLARHVPGIGSGAWAVMIGGAMVPQAMWARTFPKHGQLIACRAVLRKSALQLVAIAALSYFSGGLAAGIYGAAGGTYVAAAAGTWLSAIQAGVFIAGSVLINKVLGPKIPSVQSLAQKQIYSLSDQRNSARPYEPIPVLWGEMRVTPDLASKAYAWYEGDDQYLSTILLGGINVHSAADLAIGETPIGNYSDVSLYYNGFPGMPSQDVPLYSNVDAVAGAEFVNGGDWITRTGSAGAGALQLDIEGQLYDVDNKGNTGANSVELTIQCRAVGTQAWQPLLVTTLVNATADVVRRTFSFDVAPGQYEVRAKLGVPRWNDGGSYDACKFSWGTLKSVQADTTDYSQWGRIGIKIRASGQLNGGLDQVRATYRAKPMPIWTGSEWATATTRADGLSNPGAILLQTLRGVRNAQGQLQFGFGMSDEQIDIEGLKSFMLYCTARGYTYDKWVTSSVSLGAFCAEVALAGMGEFSWTDGSRPTAVFVANGQPNSAVVNMANMLKGGFSVDYALSNAADGIEYQWLNRETWEMTTLRVMAPGVTTMLSPARVTGEGITSEQHAAVMARYHLAQSLYQYKTINFTADIEHLDYRRLSVLSVSHDLTQWGFGGRVMAAKRIGTQVQLTLDEPVPPLATAYIGLRVPGARDYRVWAVQQLTAESDVITLVGEWPEDLTLPGEGIGNPAHDTLWCYDFKATPGYRVRVTGIDPESDLKGARVTAVPEGPEFWDYVLNGTYVPAPNQSSIPQLGRPVVKNLRVSEKVNLQGDTEWYELSCVWDVEGECDHAQVWAGRDGSELRMVDGSAQGARSTFRIDGAGEWLIVVRPFNANGQAGQSATLLYITTMTQLPPRNPGNFVVQQVEGGLRRFAWMYTGERPAAFAGVQIRYLPGDVALSVANWDAMQPLGNADDVYAAQFETTKPGAGQWTFGLRAIDTAGQLATGVMRYVAVLDKVFENIREPDLTPPPAPTGVTAVPLMTTAQVNWASPTYTVGHGHDHSVIYAALWAAGGAAPAFSVAKSVGTEQGHPASIPVELGSKYTIWVTHVSVDGVESLPSAGVSFQTAQDVGKLLDVLEGKITESQLYTDLAKEIDLISGAGTGSVNARVLAEAQARAQALASEAAARGQDMAAMAADLQATTNDLQARIDAVNAQVSDIIGASDFDQAQAYEAGQLVKYQNKLYRSKVNTVGNLPTNTTYWELVGDYASLGEAVAAHAAQLTDHTNRITQTEQGLTAEASARNTLAAQLRGNYAGNDVAQVTSGLVWSERQARVSGDSANATAIDAVKARMPTGSGKLASEASVIDEATARAAADSAAASRTTAIEARLPAGIGALATGAAVTALDTRVTAAEGGLTTQGQSITSLQNAITNGPVLPSDFSAGLGNWTAARQGSPTAVSTTPGTIVTNDADFGACADFTNWVALGANVLTKGVVLAASGRVYRVRVRCKVMASQVFPVSLNIVAGTNKSDFSLAGSDAMSGAVAVPTAGQVVDISALFSDKVANASGAVAWSASSVYLRFGLRLSTGVGTGLQVRVQSIVIEDATGETANAGAITSLTNRVTSAEGSLTSQSGSITSLQNTVSGLQTGKADASALSALDTKVTSIDGRLTSASTRIDQVQASVAGIGGAGANLLPVEYTAFGATLPPFTPVAGRHTLTMEADASALTGYVLKAVMLNTVNTTSLWMMIAPAPSYAAANMKRTSEAYIVSFEARADVEGHRIRSYMRAIKASDEGINAGGANSSHEVGLGTDWKRYSFVTVKPAGWTEAFDKMCLAFHLNISGVVGRTVWLRHCMVEARIGPSELPSEFVQGDAGSAMLSNAAAVTTEAAARANGDMALASRASALESRMPTGTGQLATAAALTAVDTKVTNIDGRVTSESTRLDLVQAAVGSAAAGLQALNPLGGESEWTAVGGAAAAAFVTAAEPDARGGAVLTVGNAAVSGERWLRHAATIPLDETKLYKLTARFRRTAGDGGIYLGIAGLNAAKSLYVTTNNAETSSISSAHYATNNVKPALGTWQVVEYFFKGRAAGAATGSGTKAAPRVFANKVAHLALMIVGNYQGQVGFFDLDYITLEDVTAAEQASADVITEAAARVNGDQANASLISQVQASVNVLAGQGVNLLPLEYSAFSAGSVPALSLSQTTVAVEADALCFLGAAIKFTSTGVGTGVSVRFAPANSYAASNMQRGAASYIIAFRAKADVAGHTVKIGLSPKSSAATQDNLSAAIALTTAWATYSVVINLAAVAADRDRMMLDFVGNFAGVTGRVVWLDSIMVEQKTGPAETPSPFVLGNAGNATLTNTAAIATEASARANADGYLGAQYTVKMALSQGGQQVVGGFGISGTSSATAGPQIDFGVLANTFWIAAPTGSPAGVGNVKPFVVQTTSQNVNGVSVPAGVYMDAAYINNVTALWARFGNLVADTIQATSISVTKLTGGNLAVGSWINSSNYVGGSTGWSINANGQAEFSQVTVRGAIYSSSGTIGGITINGNGLNSGGFSGYQWPPAGQNGFHIGPNGILLGNYSSGRYVEIQSSGNIFMPGFNIQNGNATFWGNIAGASGTFSGSLTAQEVITTGNLQRNSATVVIGASAENYMEADWDQEILALTAPAADGNSMYFVNYAYVAARVGGQVWIRLVVDGVAVQELKLPDNVNGIGNAYPMGFAFMFAGNGFGRRISLSTRGISSSLQRAQIGSRNISVIISRR